MKREAKYKAERRKVLAEQDAYLLATAKDYGQYGLVSFLGIVRRKHHMSLTDDYGMDLLRRAGHPSPDRFAAPK